ncbi:MAG: hypothetical protein IT431_11285 [Phycisphaerales bacterium]|nr:hypothetical protein [Phycisphaerales bacterium]
MRGRTRQVIVEVSPTRHELAVFEQGRLIGHRAARPAEELGLSDWPAILRSLGAELENWVPDLGVRGEPVIVVYTGPDTAASIFDAPASAGEQRARLAAKLAMAGTISFPLEQNAHAEICIFRDGSAREGEQPKLRTLALADTEATILSLAMTLERSGLTPTGFVPAPGASLAAAVHALRCSAAAGSPGVVLWIGEHSSVIAGGEGDRLSFARLIPVGTETMVEALSAPVHAGRSDNTIALDRFSARELLFASGIPTVDGWSDRTTTIDPSAVLPLLQPVLQRLVVETKQSIRFGFAPEQRPRVLLRVAGPGASISGLGTTCAGGVGVRFVQGAAPCASPQDATLGDLASVVALGWKAPSLTTRDAATKRSLAATRHAIVVGASLGLLAIGAHGVESWQRLQDARATLTLLAGGSETASSAVRAVQSSVAAGMGLARAEATRKQLFGAETPHADILRALAALTPEGVEITEITLSDDGEASRASLRGVAHAGEDMSDSDRFSAYSAGLAACPLVLGTTLGETRRTMNSDHPSLSFNLSLQLVALPTGARTAAVDGQEGTQP